MKERAHTAKMPGARKSHSAALGVALPLTTWDPVNLMLLGVLMADQVAMESIWSVSLRESERSSLGFCVKAMPSLAESYSI